MKKNNKAPIDNNAVERLNDSTQPEYKTLCTRCKGDKNSITNDCKVEVAQFPANLAAWKEYFENENELVAFIEQQIIAHKLFSAARNGFKNALSKGEIKSGETYVYAVEKLERRKPSESSQAKQIASKLKELSPEKLAQIQALLGL
nr:MAG TPA: hypothetical protein [Caudoviricetes sp.]